MLDLGVKPQRSIHLFLSHLKPLLGTFLSPVIIKHLIPIDLSSDTASFDSGLIISARTIKPFKSPLIST